MAKVSANITIEVKDEAERKLVETFLKKYTFTGEGFAWMDSTMKGGNMLAKPYLTKMLKPKGL